MHASMFACVHVLVKLPGIFELLAVVRIPRYLPLFGGAHDDTLESRQCTWSTMIHILDTYCCQKNLHHRQKLSCVPVPDRRLAVTQAGRYHRDINVRQEDDKQLLH